MTHIMRKFNYTLFDFQGSEMVRLFQDFENAGDAIAHGAELFWEYPLCARVLVEDNYNFKVNIEWGESVYDSRFKGAVLFLR